MFGLGGFLGRLAGLGSGVVAPVAALRGKKRPASSVNELGLVVDAVTPDAAATPGAAPTVPSFLIPSGIGAGGVLPGLMRRRRGKGGLPLQAAGALGRFMPSGVTAPVLPPSLRY